ATTPLTGEQPKPLARALLKAIARLETAEFDQIELGLPATGVGFPEDLQDRFLGARQIFLRDGWVSAETLRASVALVRGRASIPAKVAIPRAMERLLLTNPLREVLDSRQ